MFDNPQKELERLEEQLLKTEEDDFEQFYQKIFEEFGPEEEQEQLPVRQKKTSTYADAPRAVAPKKKDKSIRRLLILILLECLGIAGVILWWVLRLV